MSAGGGESSWCAGSREWWEEEEQCPTGQQETLRHQADGADGGQAGVGQVEAVRGHGDGGQGSVHHEAPPEEEIGETYWNSLKYFNLIIGKCWYHEGQERQYTEHDNGHHTVQAEREAEPLYTILR